MAANKTLPEICLVSFLIVYEISEWSGLPKSTLPNILYQRQNSKESKIVCINSFFIFACSNIPTSTQSDVMPLCTMSQTAAQLRPFQRVVSTQSSSYLSCLPFIRKSKSRLLYSKEMYQEIAQKILKNMGF